ncbi:CGNR zinc finger domain-containing protein [Pseudomonas sp. MH9.2]|uniref:CGNR zinc finger domain-containing protein n=1 Tax=Pseudomonas sp. MH9.2 TaxID=3048629 RepID=UPI002AC896E8|nr:CGNR zinc finger domain-containing protein [Pseudomonas sp. MH9.2]MEB0027727.1 CGNR zinc finger domain-containing protein [Pseudomonas sp. MH9.2]WPX68537.1 CGNR zinc finger domain-containing protein [Pseudomonas sp. MH9.2]
MFPHKWPKSAFVAGNAVLDFLNTVDAHGRSVDQDRLTSYASALAWGEAADLIDSAEFKRIADTASSAPADSEQALNDLVQWREAVYRVFEAIVRNEAPPADDWKTVETSIKKAISSALLSRDKVGATSWKTSPAITDLTTIPQRLALGLHELLASDLVAKIKQCEGCTWLFIDTSKNHRRRWCSMATCGNRAKAQRHYQVKATAE